MTISTNTAEHGVAPVFERLDVFKFVVFTSLTGGLYMCYWLHKVRPGFEAIGPLHAISGRLTTMFYLFSALELVAFVLYDEKMPFKHSPQVAPYLAAGLVLFILVFQMKRALHVHFVEQLGLKLPISGVMTFMFGAFYVQHVINRGLTLHAASLQADFSPLPAIAPTA